MSDWWYYGAQTLDGFHKGIYPDSLAFLPRMLLANAEVDGMACMDAGCMEGIVSVLLAKRGATVTAWDEHTGCISKLDMLRSLHGVRYQANLGIPIQHWGGGPFDLINLSGLLYHVVSPLEILMQFRSQLKPNGLLLVSTNVLDTQEPVMRFNARGALQGEANTFWYVSHALLRYWLAMLGLQVIDEAYLVHADVEKSGPVFISDTAIHYTASGVSTGYLSLMCRAVETVAPDGWAASCMANSTEIRRLYKPVTAEPSYIRYEKKTLVFANHNLMLGDRV